MDDRKTLTDMLDRAGVGYGTRKDYNPDGMAVRVEGVLEGEGVAEFWFGSDGSLKRVNVYSGD